MASPGTAAAVLDGIRVLDLSWGAAGPMATMLLADHGAAVTRIERPGGEPFDDVLDGYRVWHRGKRSAVLDLKDPGDLARFRALVAQSDILIESFAPGVTARLGIAYADLKDINPRLIYCSITGYGRENRHSGRPAFDALVAARTGLQWEARGWDGGPINRILGRDRPPSDFPPVPDALRIGSDRLGPIFTATPAPSVTTAHLAVIGVSAALLARESTGVGQHVETSMLQAAILFSGCSWQRPEHPDAPGYQMAALDRRQNWGMVQAADRWMCFWTSPPEWAKAAGEGGILRVPDPSVVEERMKARALATGRARRMVGVDKQLEHLAEAAPIFAQFPAADWTRTAAEAGVALQPVRTPEEALTDPAFVADGSVAELVDPDVGVVRQAGILFRLRDRPTTVRTPSPNRGEHTAELCAEAERIPAPRKTAQPSGKALPRGPLDGVRVVDIGLAVAGPWCAQILADLGADVVKVDPSRQGFWFPTHMSVGVNRSKRSIHLDMKHPEGLKAVRKLIDRADVVVHNMRIGAAERLKVDYETVRQTNPRLVYCHTRGFEDGPRAHLPGHDQAGNALGGTEWEDGGCWDGGRPYFSALSGGDLGNGFFGAAAVILALWDRARSGKGQAVDTSIVNASLFNNSRIYSTPDGHHFDRPTLDAGQFGLSALYRLYSCSQGWLCIAVLSDAHWAALVKAVPILDGDRRFATAADRQRHDLELAEILSTVFSTNAADQWFGRLDDCSVPCEVSSDRFSRDLFDDADLRALKWITTCETEALGRIDMFGNGIDFSATPAAPGGPPPTLGQHTGEVLRDLGYTEAEVAALHASGAVNCAERPS